MAHPDLATERLRERIFAVVFAAVVLVTASWLSLYGGPLPIFGMPVGSAC